MALTNRGLGSTWDPSFDTFRSNFDRLFDDFSRDLMSPAWSDWNTDWGTTLPAVGAAPRRRRRGRRLAGRILDMDMKDIDNNYEVRIDIPGVNKDDIKLYVDNTDNTITVDTVRPRDFEGEPEGKGTFLFRECPFGRLHRLVTMPNDADVDKADVKYNNGVLQLTVPKTEGAAGGGRRLEIA